MGIGKVSDKMIQNKEFFTVPDFDRKIQEATYGALLSSLITLDIYKDNGLPIALGTWKLVSIGRQNLPL